MTAAGIAPAHTADRGPVARRWVSWSLVALGSLEVPWVIYLMFFQEPVVEAHHVRLTTVGLGLAAAGLCLASAWGIWRRRWWAPIVAVAGTTVLAFVATLASLGPDGHATGLLGPGLDPELVALPALVAGVWAAWTLLPTSIARNPSPHASRVAALILAGTTVPLVLRMASQVQTMTSTSVFDQARLFVVLLDTAQVVGLLGSGRWCLRRWPGCSSRATRG